MDCFTILVGQLEVVFDHIQRGVAQQLLEDKDIAAVPQKRNGKGVSEAMGRGIGHTGPFPDAADEA
jgi:hypothetical protein